MEPGADEVLLAKIHQMVVEEVGRVSLRVLSERELARFYGMLSNGTCPMCMKLRHEIYLIVGAQIRLPSEYIPQLCQCGRG